MRRRDLPAALAVLLASCLPVSDGRRQAAAPSPTPTSTPTGTTTVPSGEVTTAPEPAAARVRLYARMEYDPISPAQLDAVGALDGVAEVRALRTDDVALWSSARSDGTAVDALPAGFKISLAGLVADTDTPVAPGPGEVVLTAAGRAFRDLDVGGTMVLADEVPRTVVAISDDPAIQHVEVVLDEQDADAMGFRPLQRMTVLLTPDADPDAVQTAVEQVLGDNGIVQQRPVEGRPLVLSLPETKARFGEFAFRDLEGRDIQQGVSWIREYIVEEVVPLLGDVNCNKEILPDLVAALEEIQARGLAGEIDPDLYGGCWSPRRINKNANLSRHSWGIAVDINVDFTKPGLGPIPSEGVIEAFELHGFRWGGDYPIPDNHHFEWVGHG